MKYATGNSCPGIKQGENVVPSKVRKITSDGQ